MPLRLAAETACLLTTVALYFEQFDSLRTLNDSITTWVGAPNYVGAWIDFLSETQFFDLGQLILSQILNEAFLCQLVFATRAD